ncbi:molybdopterin-guanine dinucleotide biosynthesis protein MobB [Halobacteroides halobius DSM 5150]|uniref:Molybdopterin-guanine dinucleotide biosynthesis protein MobB n=1 Tax=Halobacteroides halobius (strain ATCC 35273 / DSM 5150 / MD-1) TaxID=748449 RepID=L0K9Z1_HALHC|nr:molybdopterin-guanine dinucleotide biosynthesis protein B [Halobacteroides halobius]AGB41194.1 molybdopterin-guanine dinucleotide biosynthesis protein MobB [Halobacteroides halobius DSM 5150]
MIPIVSIVGWSNSGKTTFITELIPALKEKGYKVATIKHDAHKFQIDKPGKDSWQHREAGAKIVILSSSDKVAMIKEVREEPSVETLVEEYIDSDIDSDFDLVLAEGYKTGSTSKVEVFRPNVYNKPAVDEENLLLRVINDSTREELLAQVDRVCKVIEKEVL